MSCEKQIPFYLPNSDAGLVQAVCHGDGYTIGLGWTQAYPSVQTNKVAYNIYYSSEEENVFSEGVKYIAIKSDGLTADVTDLTPGDLYYFAVRAIEYDPAWFTPDSLPNAATGLKLRPEGLLLQDISETSLTIPVSDVELFPAYGIVQIGYELIRYTSKSISDGYLIASQRGYLATNAREHLTDGYDGYSVSNPIVKFWYGHEEQNKYIIAEEMKFDYPSFAYTDAAGYKKIDSLVTTDLSASDTNEQDFPSYDYAGWHRIDPLAMFKGDFVGSYAGGERYCADGYLGVGRRVRGASFEDFNNQREEMLLRVSGEPCMLIRRLYSGIPCSCMTSSAEFAESKCEFCYGVGFLGGYEQFFNPRRSDGRILVRFGPSEESIKIDDNGLESVYIPNCKTLVYPSIKDRDFIIRFDEDGHEEFRYEISGVTRNKLLYGKSAAQKFKAIRVRKTDPIYQWRAIRNTATQPTTLETSLAMTDKLPPHKHTIVINEGIVSLSQINQTTSIANSHNHAVIDGVVQPTLGHTHTIVLP